MPKSCRLLTVAVLAALGAALCLIPPPTAQAQQRFRRTPRAQQSPPGRTGQLRQPSRSADAPAQQPTGEEPQGPQPPSRIPGDILSSTQPLTEEQAQAVQEYVTGWSQVLIQAPTPDRISEARAELLNPLRSQVSTPTFLQQYVPLVIGAIEPAVGSENMLVKLNALIVASQLPADQTVDLAIGALRDPTPAVRYWAAKLVADAAGGGSENAAALSPQQQQQVLAILRQAIPAEQEDNVLGQMFRGLSNLTINEATAAMLDLLRQRVAYQVTRIRPGLRADRAAMANLQSRIANLIAQGQDADAQLRGLTAVAAQYARVVAEALQSQQVPDDLVPVAVRTIGTAEDIFLASVNRFAPDVTSRPPLLPLAREGNYSELLLNVLAWVGSRDSPGILTESEVSIPREQMDPPPPRLRERRGGETAPDTGESQPQEQGAQPGGQQPTGGTAPGNEAAPQPEARQDQFNTGNQMPSPGDQSQSGSGAGPQPINGRSSTSAAP